MMTPEQREAERRHVLSLSEEQLDEIADRAVDRAFERIQLEVGRSVLRKVQWAAGAILLAVAAWLSAQHIKWE